MYDKLRALAINGLAGVTDTDIETAVETDYEDVGYNKLWGFLNSDITLEQIADADMSDYIEIMTLVDHLFSQIDVNLSLRCLDEVTQDKLHDKGIYLLIQLKLYRESRGYYPRSADLSEEKIKMLDLILDKGASTIYNYDYTPDGGLYVLKAPGGVYLTKRFNFTSNIIFAEIFTSRKRAEEAMEYCEATSEDITSKPRLYKDRLKRIKVVEVSVQEV